MTYFFEFEKDLVDSLRSIPMIVRMKLDTCGIKLKLTHWNEFNQEERDSLVLLACETEEEAQNYRENLQNLVNKYMGKPASELSIEPHPPWLKATAIPQELLDKVAQEGVSLSLEQWESLTPLQRFALIKLSRPSHENHNFIPAMKEFNLI